MASTHKHLRSSTADKRPTTAIADGQIALNTNTASPGLFFKDSTGASIIKVGPVHVGTTAPNATPPSGGSSGNSTGEVWLDTSLTPPGVKIWNGSIWVNATPAGSTTVQGLLELATNAETQAGTDVDRAVTPAGLQSKVSDSVSTSSSTTIASSTAVKTAYDLANAALARSGGTITGNLEIGTTGSLSFEGSTADAFETTIAVVDPTADRTITLPDTTGTVVTTGDTGTVTSTMIVDGTIVSGDIASGTIVDSNISATAEIAVSKLADGAARQLLQTDAAGTGVEWTNNIDIPGTLDVTSTATFDSIAQYPAGSAGAPAITFTGDTNTGIYSPGADQLAISTNGSGRLFVDASGRVGIGVSGGNLAHPLHVRTDQAGYTWTRIENQSSSASAYSGLQLGAFGNSWGLTAGSSAANSNALSFVIDAGGTNVERLRITSAGLVGIGTSSPSQALHVVASANQALFEGGTQGNITIQKTGTLGMSLYSDGAGKLTFYDNAAGVNRVAIDSSGRVGIGTTAPLSQFVVSNGGAAGLEVSPTGFGSAPVILSYNRSGAAYTQLTLDGASNVFAISGTERARLDSSGRLLVGTSTSVGASWAGVSDINPQLQIAGITQATASASFVNYSSTGNAATLVLGSSKGGTVATQGQVGSDAQLGRLVFNGSDGTKLLEAARIEGLVDGAPGANDMPGRLVFSTTADGASSPTERMRINNQGGISGFAAGGWDNYVASNSSAAGTSVSFYNGRHSATGTFTGTNSYYVWTNGNVQNTNGSYTAISDAKLKENIVDAGSQWNDLKAIRIRNWNFKAETGHETHRQIGPIAQELETVCPGLVFATPDRDEDGNETGEVTKGVNQSVLYMKAVKALQEAMERIETLEAKVAALESA